MCVGIPARVVHVIEARPEFALIEIDGARREVSLALLEGDPPGPGEWVLTQLGFALERMTESEADEATRLLRALTSETEDKLLADLEAMAVAAWAGDDRQPA